MEFCAVCPCQIVNLKWQLSKQRLAALSDVLQRIPYFYIHLHQPTKGQESKAQISLKKKKKKIPADPEPQHPGTD